MGALIGVTLVLSRLALADNCPDSWSDCYGSIAGEAAAAMGIGVAVGVGALGLGSRQGPAGGAGGPQKYASAATSGSPSQSVARGCSVFGLMFSFFFGWAFGVIGRAGRAVISFFR